MAPRAGRRLRLRHAPGGMRDDKRKRLTASPPARGDTLPEGEARPLTADRLEPSSAGSSARGEFEPADATSVEIDVEDLASSPFARAPTHVDPMRPVLSEGLAERAGPATEDVIELDEAALHEVVDADPDIDDESSALEAATPPVGHQTKPGGSFAASERPPVKDDPPEQDTDPHFSSPPDPGIVALRAPLVGRKEQLNQLKEAFLDSWNQRRVNLVTLLGPSGSGKTRVAREFARSVNAAIPDARVLWGSSTETSSTPYEAIAGALAARFGIGHAEQPEDVRTKITKAVAESLPEPLQEEVSHLISHLMGVPFPESPVIDSLARELRDLELRCHIAVRRFFEQQSAKGPLLLCFDGMESAGTETVNLLHYLAQNMPAHPVLILVAARPSLTKRHPDWGKGDLLHHRIELPPLAADEMLALFRALLSVDSVPAEVADVVHDKLEGSPRAVYDFARYLLEARAVRGDEGHWQFWRPRLAELELPQTHQALIRARLRALPSAEREIVMQAAAIGEVFWVDTLVALARVASVSPETPDGPSLEQIAAWGEQTSDQVLSLLSALCQRGLVVDATSSTIAGEREYSFAYEPICELSYELYDFTLQSAASEGGDEATLQQTTRIRRLRRDYHRLIAQWIQLRPDAGLELRKRQIAHQLERAGDSLVASRYHREAADAAWKQHDGDKAIAGYRHAIACIGGSNLRARLQLWHAIGEVESVRGRQDAALDAFERTLRLAWAIASRPRAAIAFNRMGRVWRTKGNLDLALEYLTRGLDMSREARDVAAEAACLDDVGQVYWVLGRYDVALDDVAKALEIRRRLGDKEDIASSLTTLGRIERDRGLLSAAESCFREALSLRREQRSRHGYLVSLADLGTLQVYRTELEQARDGWERTLREATRLGARPLCAQLQALLATLAIRRNEIGQARQHTQQAIDLAADSQDQLCYIEAIRTLGVVELLSGDTDKGRHYIEESIALASNPEMLPRGESAMLPSVARAHLAVGEVHAATLFDASAAEGPPPAETSFLKAVELLRQMGAQADLALALKRLGEYRMERGEWEGARSVLRDALDIAKLQQLPSAEAIERTLAGAA